MASPDPKRQQQYQQQDQQTPPEYKPFEEEQGKKRNTINEENYKKIESVLNNFKNGFYDFLKKKFPSSYEDYINEFDYTKSANYQIRRALGSVEALNFYLWEYVSLYRGEFIGFYLEESAMELLYSALGPIGNIWRLGNKKKISWRMAWAKNLLNPNAIYYYFHSLPQYTAFRLLKHPISGAFSILAKGGSPFISKVHTQEYNQQGKEVITSKYVFSPAYRLTQLNHGLVDKFEKLSGIQKPEIVNEKLSDLLLSLNRVKTKDEKNKVIGALQNELFKIDGSPLKRAFANAARRLGAHERDPIINLLSFLIGGIVDFTIGAVLNSLKIAAIRTVSLIPGFTILRGKIINFFTSNRWLNTARIGGITTQSFARGLFSPTTLSSSYLGWRGGNLLSQAIGLFNPTLAATLNPYLSVGLGAISGGLGAFYQTSTILTRYGLQDYYGHLMPAGWTQRIQALEKIANSQTVSLAERQMALSELNSISLKGFKPGPFIKLSSWLYQHPFARLPINGLAIGDLVAPLMKQYFGWNPWVTRLTFAATDYLWQVKGPLINSFMKKWYLPQWNVGIKVKIFNKTFGFSRSFISPYTRFQGLSLRLQRFYWEKIAHVWEPGTLSFTERGWFRVANRSLKFAKPFAQNFFNPGFFMGFGLVPILSPTMGAWAYVIGPVAGSLAWNASAFILERTFGMRIASMAKINAWGWAGYITGSILDLVIPGAQAWLPIAGAFGFPVIGMIFTALNLSLTNILAAALAPIYTAFPALAGATASFAGWMAGWATALSIGSVAGLTVFFAYTIYAGFWVPMIEEGTAGPQSSNFSISNNCTQTASNKYNCCSNFRLSADVFNSLNHLDHKTDLTQAPNVSVDLTDPNQTMTVTRNSTRLNWDPAADALFYLSPDKYTVSRDPNDLIIEGQQLTAPFVVTYLSTPTNQQQNLFQIMQQYPAAIYSFTPFFDILKKLAEEHNQTAHLIKEYEAQLDIIKEQKKLVDDLLASVKNNNLTEALSATNNYLNKNPLTDPCPDPAQICPVEKQGLKQLFDSWENIVNGYISQITGYTNQTTPDLQPFIDLLEQDREGLQQQIDMLPDIINQMEDIQKDLTDADAQLILNTNFTGFSRLDPNQQKQIYDNILAKYFKDVFDPSKTFYFIPQNTNYQVCMDMNYSGPAGVEQQICSSISYQPSIWGPNTAFAKSCSTFTP